jgi:hypothetical protein
VLTRRYSATRFMALSPKMDAFILPRVMFIKQMFSDHGKEKLAALDLLADFQTRGAGVFGTA